MNHSVELKQLNFKNVEHFKISERCSFRYHEHVNFLYEISKQLVSSIPQNKHHFENIHRVYITFTIRVIFVIKQ